MPRQTRKKKGGKTLELSEMDTEKVNKLEKENDNNNKSLKGGMENELVNEFSNNNKNMEENKMEENNKNIEGGNNIQMNVNENQNQNQNNASSMLNSMGNMLKNAVSGITGGSKNKVGGSNNLESKLFTSLKARSNKLNENLAELDSMQKNLNAKTNTVKNEVQGLQEQFKLYNKMSGGKKSRRKSKKHHKSKRRSHQTRRTKHKRRRRSKH
jgi:hypothetical protein